MLRIIALTIVTALTASASVASSHHAHPYRRHWVHATFGKAALARVAAGAGIGQLTNHPKSYGHGIEGFGKRIGAGFGSHAVGTTVEHLVAAPLHEDLHYHRSSKKGFGPRLAYALRSTVVTRDLRNGKREPAMGRFAGHAASGIVSQAAFHTGSGFATAGVGFAADAGANVAREFWPRRKTYSARLRHHR